MALGGVARGGATRAGHTSPKLCLSVNGVERGWGRALDISGVMPAVEASTFTITKALNEASDTATFTASKWTPTVGMEVIARLGSVNNLEREFGGQILSVDQAYEGMPDNQEWAVSCIDFTWGLNKRKVSGYYTGSPTTIVPALLAEWSTGYTSANVQADLPTLVGGITFTNEDLTTCLSRLAERAGASWYCDYNKDIHFFIVEVWKRAPTAPTPLTATNTLFSDLVVSRDLSQVVTRVYAEGGGDKAAANVEAGETVLLVGDGSWYAPGGGVVVSGPQRITYTSMDPGGGGGLVGVGVYPVAAMVASADVGTGIEAGEHDYALTFTTAAGETLPGPIVSVTAGALSLDTAPQVYASGFFSGGVTPGVHEFAFTFVTSDGGETLPSPRRSYTVVAGYEYLELWITPNPSTLPAVTSVRVYHTPVGGSTLQFADVINGPPWGSGRQRDRCPDADLGAAPPVTNTTNLGQAELSQIQVGPPGTTGRKIYRTVAGGTALLLAKTIAENTSVGPETDSAADASLGAAVPTSDTSGLAVVDGAVLAGATSIPVAGLGGFPSSGWARVAGEQMIRYTSKTTTTLAGIPSSGAGAITSTISYNSVIVAMAQLSGIPASGAGSILYPILSGDDVNIWITRNDTAAQTALAALIGGDGIQEDYIQDRRLAQTECEARGDARLALKSAVEVGISYTTRDVNTRPGGAIVVDLAAPTSVDASFRIQSVVVSNFKPAVFPDRRVEAAPTRTTFERVLQTTITAALTGGR
jgi:hypothetical protein